LWWDSSDDAGVLFIWYDDADGGQWVEASGTGQDLPLWSRTGTTLSPATAGDDVFTSGDVKVGGTTATPNIGLNADGSATFGGALRQSSASGYIWTHEPGNANFYSAMYANGSFESSPAAGAQKQYIGKSGGTVNFVIENDGTLEIGSTASPNIALHADGNVFFIGAYNSTNSTISANVGVFSTGQLRRITSSSKYKTDIEDITDEYADKVLQLRPVWYRSLCEGDEGKSSYGFIAEEVAQVDPRFASYDSDGNPDGVNYAMLVVHLTDIAQRQTARIEALEAKLAALEGGTN
jgi:hypothetical protein